MLDLFNNEFSGAEFSECGQYRYGLWRKWDNNKPNIMFIGLNPSTVTATMDDPTIRRVKRFAIDWGYGGWIIENNWEEHSSKQYWHRSKNRKDWPPDETCEKSELVNKFKQQKQSK